MAEPVEPFSRWLAVQVLTHGVRPLTRFDDNPFSAAEGYFWSP